MVDDGQYEVIAKRLLASIKDDIKECNTAECQKMRAEADRLNKMLYEEGGDKVLAKVNKLDEDIVKLLDAQEKMLSASIEVPPCQHCGYNEDEKPKVVGRCKTDDHFVEYDEYDKSRGMKKCAICGDDINWD